MQNTSVAGRRGEVLWKKGSFLTGGGMERNYDTFVVGWEFVIPFTLHDLVHIWDISTLKFGSCKAILLRPDPVFKRQVLVSAWFGAAAVGLFFASLVLWLKVHAALGLLALVAAVGCSVVAFLYARETSRSRDIRLVLGQHTWGSSDPATWHENLRMHVISPCEALRVETFAEAAQHAINEGKWDAAMWAARFSVLVEDEAAGERLTDDILRRPEVMDRLRRVRSHPDRRNHEFGGPLSLEPWITCDPQEFIFEID